MAASSVSCAPSEPKILNRSVQMCAANHPDDGYREPAIRLDAVCQASHGKPARDTHRGAVLIFHTRAVEQCKLAARCCVQGLYAACVRDARRLRLGAIGWLLLLNSRRKAPNELYPECSSSSLVVHGLVLGGLGLRDLTAKR